MMAFKINLISYIILLLWTSTSAKLHAFSGNWSVEIEKCENDGSDTVEGYFDVGVLDPADFSYDALNEQTIVTAEGKIGTRTEITGPNMNTTLTLDNFVNKDDSKEYSARLWLMGGNGRQTQQAYVQPNVLIYGDGTVKLKLTGFAESLKSRGCAEAKSILSQISINI